MRLRFLEWASLSSLHAFQFSAYVLSKLLVIPVRRLWSEDRFASVMEKTSVSSVYWRNSFNEERVKLRLSSAKRTKYRLGSL